MTRQDEEAEVIRRRAEAENLGKRGLELLAEGTELFRRAKELAEEGERLCRQAEALWPKEDETDNEQRTERLHELLNGPVKAPDGATLH